MKKFNVWTVMSYIFLTIWAATTVYPFIWVFINSFKTTNEILTNSFALPTTYSLDNYRLAFERVSVWRAYGNSLIISGTVTVCVMILAGLGAYGLARYNFKGRSVLYGLVLASMMIPVFATIIPVYKIILGLNLVNNPFGVALPQIAGNLSFAMIILTGYIRGIPVEMEESAFLEGCSIYGIIYKIIVPIAKPSFATVAIFTFIWSYNDLFTQLFFLRYKESFAITRLLNEISSIAGTNYGLMAAAVVMVVIPVMILYIAMQKNIIKGLTAGAVKG